MTVRSVLRCFVQVSEVASNATVDQFTALLQFCVAQMQDYMMCYGKQSTSSSSSKQLVVVFHCLQSLFSSENSRQQESAALGTKRLALFTFVLLYVKKF